MFKILTIASMSLALATGAALAQTDGGESGTGGEGGAVGSDAGEAGTQGTGEAGTADSEAGTPATGTTSTGQSGSGDNFTDEDRAMMDAWMEQEGVIEAFFTDDTMTTMRTEEEMSASFSALTPEQQDMIRASCEQATMNRGVHGTVTLGLCQQVGAF